MARRRQRGTLGVVGLMVGLLVLCTAAIGCSEGSSGGRSEVEGASSAPGGQPAKGDPGGATSPRVTFVELGSDRCIPCIQMREVMKQVEDRYGEQVRIVFHDVWTPEGEPYARQYRIRVIPTQVFLDAQGQEYFRHEGYFPIAGVAEILALKGVR